MKNKSSILTLSMAFGMLLSGAWVWSEGATAAKKKLSLKDLLNSSKSTSRRASTVAGVRGLDETSAGEDSKARDYEAVDRLDKVTASEEDVKAFIVEGQLK